MELVGPNRGTSCGGSCAVLAHEALDRIGAKATARAGREQWFVSKPRPLSHPDREDRLGRSGQWNGPVFAPFALTANVRPRAEADVATIQSGELRDAQSGLDASEQQRSVASTFPTSSIGCVDQRIDFERTEERNDGFLEAFGRDEPRLAG